MNKKDKFIILYIYFYENKYQGDILSKRRKKEKIQRLQPFLALTHSYATKKEKKNKKKETKII